MLHRRWEYHGLEWSPDGARLVVDDLDNITLLDPASGRSIKRFAGYAVPSWSPDGRFLTFETDDVFVVDVLKAAGRFVTHTARDGGVTGHVHWHPDGLASGQLGGESASLRPRTDSFVRGSVLRTRGSIAEVVVSGGRVVVNVSSTDTECTHVEVWRPGGPIRLMTTQACGADPYGEGRWEEATRLAFARGRALWIEYRGDEILSSGTLRTATLTRRPEVGVAGTPLPTSTANGDSLIVIATTAASSGDRPETTVWRLDGELPRAIWHRAGFAWVDDVSDSRIVVRRADARVELLDASGAPLRAFRVQRGTRAVRLGGAVLAAARRGELALYDAATGRLRRTLSVPRDAELADAAVGLAVLVHGRRIILVRLADGRTVSLRLAGHPPFDAALDEIGLFVSARTLRRAFAGRVEFIPRAALTRRLLRVS